MVIITSHHYLCGSSKQGSFLWVKRSTTLLHALLLWSPSFLCYSFFGIISRKLGLKETQNLPYSTLYFPHIIIQIFPLTKWRRCSIYTHFRTPLNSSVWFDWCLQTHCILSDCNDFWREYHLSNLICLNPSLHHSRVYLRALLHRYHHPHSASLWVHRQKPSSHRNLQGSPNNLPCLLNMHNFRLLRCNQCTSGIQ